MCSLLALLTLQKGSQGEKLRKAWAFPASEPVAKGLFSHVHSLGNLLLAAVLGTLRAPEVRYDIPVVFCETAGSAALRVELWAFYFAREVVQVVNDLWRSLPD